MAVQRLTTRSAASEHGEGARELLRRDYDTIIVGGGAAGVRLASELVRREDRDVLLLESGASHAGPNSRVPAFYPRAFGGRLDWGYATVPQRHLGGRKITLPSGKLLGGSTGINAMIWIEPSDGCLLEFQEAGGEQWNVARLREDFDSLRGEMLGNGYLSAPALHPNTGGFDFQLQKELGWDSVILDRARLGVGAYRRAQQGGRRVSSAELLRNVDGKLTVLTEADVETLHWCGERVQGVNLRIGGESVAVKGSQIVLCCGAIGTPALLYKSGIGPAEILREAGLVVRHALEGVGQGLQDHLIYPMVYRLESGVPFGLPMNELDRRSYLQDAEGPKASNLSEYGGFFDAHGRCVDLGKSQREDLSLRGNLGASPVFQWHVTPTDYLRYPRYKAEYPTISVGVSLCKPRSRGAVRIRRDDARDGGTELLIDPNYLGDEADYVALREAVLSTRRILKSLVQFSDTSECELGANPRVAEEVFPGESRGDETVAVTIRKFSTTLYHYSSSCRFGVDRLAPLDTQLRVKGLDGLYVCDASVLPSVLGCNPQATVQVLAKRLATWI